MKYCPNAIYTYGAVFWSDILRILRGRKGVFLRLSGKTYYIAHTKYPRHGRGACVSIVTDKLLFRNGNRQIFMYIWVRLKNMLLLIGNTVSLFHCTILHTVYLLVQRLRKPTLINYYHNSGYVLRSPVEFTY